MNRPASWYWHRLRAMSAAETAARARRACRVAAWRRRTAWPTPEPGAGVADSWTPTALPGGAEREKLLAEAESYLRGEYHLLNCAVHESPPDWHRDPQTGRRAPTTFSFGIDFHDARLVGNIKTLWEKNRHHHLTVLALAFALTRDERFAREVERQLRSWLDENPFPRGVNWASPLELGVRLIAWRWIERLLRGAAAHDALFGPRGALWPAIYRHQWLIAALHSRGSSANNHLIGELSGLFIAASAWPVFAESKRWRALALRGLEREIIRQTFPSGLDREQAFGYHIFALELFLLPALEDRNAFSAAYRDRLRRMLEVIPPLTDDGGNLPRHGDGDEGMAVQLQPLGSRRDGWLLRVGRGLLGVDVPLNNTDGILAASVVGCAPGSNPPTPRDIVAFDDAGLYALKNDNLFVLADAGPHGFGPTASHAHADALAFTLSVGGVPLFVDTGTFDYLVDERWRNYFRSTRAHNTVVVDGLDQSTQSGPFLWSRQAKTTVESWDGHALVASHDGYARLGVTHRRRLELRDNILRITDTLDGAGEHEATLCFHLAPECAAQRDGAALVVTRGGARVRMSLPGEPELVTGAENGGWYSPSFGVKKECVSIFVRRRGPLPVELTTVLEIQQ